MVELDVLQFVVGDELFYQVMCIGKGIGVFDVQFCEIVDVEEVMIIDVVGGKLLMVEFVVLMFEQMMQCECLCRLVFVGLIGVDFVCDEIGCVCDFFQFGFEGGSFFVVGVVQIGVVGCQ